MADEVTLDRPGTKAMRVGAAVVASVLTLAIAVTFSTPMPSASYTLFLQPQLNTASVFWPSNLAIDGFTLNIGTGIVGSVHYLAVEN